MTLPEIIKSVNKNDSKLYKNSLGVYPYQQLTYYIILNKHGVQNGFWFSDRKIIPDSIKSENLDSEYFKLVS